MKIPIRLALVDDEPLFRKGMRYIMEAYDDVEVCMEASDGLEFIQQLENSGTRPDIVLLDMKMTEMNGMETTRYLALHFPDIRVVILSLHFSEAFVTHMIGLGACAYLAKNSDPEEVYKAVRTVQEKGFYYSDATVDMMRNSMLKKKKAKAAFAEGEPPTKREIEILKLICQQYTNAEIAEKLFLSQRTVDGHRNNLLEKTGARNTVGLVLYALANGYFEIGPGDLL